MCVCTRRKINVSRSEATARDALCPLKSHEKNHSICCVYIDFTTAALTLTTSLFRMTRCSFLKSPMHENLPQHNCSSSLSVFHAHWKMQENSLGCHMMIGGTVSEAERLFDWRHQSIFYLCSVRRDKLQLCHLLGSTAHLHLTTSYAINKNKNKQFWFQFICLFIFISKLHVEGKGRKRGQN